MKCLNCGKEYDQEYHHCPWCGEKQDISVTCFRCGKTYESKYPYCPWCGEQAHAADETPSPTAAPHAPKLSTVVDKVIVPPKRMMSTGAIAVITLSLTLCALLVLGYILQGGFTSSHSSSRASSYDFSSSKVSSRESSVVSKPSLLEQRAKCASLISVSKVHASKPNSAGGVDVSIEWKNKSDKTIKYAYFTVLPYNAVDDVVRCKIRNYQACTVAVTGPIKPGASHGADGLWECVWYNSTITWARLGAIEIEYMDGTKEAFAGQELTEACPKYFCNYTP